jgi:hypothetical protein
MVQEQRLVVFDPAQGPEALSTEQSIASQHTIYAIPS